MARSGEAGQQEVNFPYIRSAQPACSRRIPKTANTGLYSFDPSTTPLSHYDFSAALLGFDLASDVKAGENRGRRLEHDFVVLGFANCASRKEGESFTGELSLIAKPALSGKRVAVAAWVAPSKDVAPTQAVGGWLGVSTKAER